MLNLIKYCTIICLSFSTQVYSFRNKKFIPELAYVKTLLLNPQTMINYLTSIKDYTIITDNDINKDLEDLMIQNNFNVYYFNINNLLNKNEILEILIKNHKNLESADNLWIFHQSYFFGSRNDIYQLIKKKEKNNKKN